jgi:hypothetical protein|tara:strand:+ start:656 stop:919 length:264 start_codon:yes stop_codon:yes gene_type:complete
MNDVIDIKKFRRKKKMRDVGSAEVITRDGVAALLHSLHAHNFPIDDAEFQTDLALAFKFIHAAVSKHYGLENPFYKAIDKFKKEVKW